MEKKQLNFDTPLLSVRKSTIFGSSDGSQRKMVKKSPPLLCHSASIKTTDFELEEVTKTGTVPFVWEQIPGRPKGDGTETIQIPTQPSSTPRLPPGRPTDFVKRSSCDRPNDYYNTKSQFEAYPLNDHSALIEILRDGVYGNEESDLESVDDAYSDALDALESLSLNCSISGLSDFEVTDTQPCGTFIVDEQTGEFMMNRFLPAAKAAILETPQYVSKKQSVVPEPVKRVRSVVSDERQSSLDKLHANLIMSHYQYAEVVKSDREDNDRDKRTKRSGKTSSFLPHLCVKNSLCIVNPVPVMKSSAPVPKSAANDIRRLTRKAYSGPVDRLCRDQNKKKRCHSGVLSHEPLRVDSKMLPPIRFSYSGASSRTGGLSPRLPSRKGGLSAYGNATFRPLFNKVSSFFDARNEVENCAAHTKCSHSKKSSNLSALSFSSGYTHEAHPLDDDVESGLPLDDLTSLDILKKVNAGNPKSLAKPCISKLQAVEDKMESANLKPEVEQLRADEISGKTEPSDVNLQTPLPPPLPKSPSDSWLWQTMPYVHSRNPKLHSNHAILFHSKKQGRKPSISSTNWETIVKTSHSHHSNRRFSEELGRHISH